MIRNFLYSFFLHFILVLFVIFDYLANSKNIINYISSIEDEIEGSIINISEIKPSKIDLYPKIDIEGKINLYRLAKKYVSNNKKVSDVPLDEFNSFFNSQINNTIKSNSKSNDKAYRKSNVDLFDNLNLNNEDILFLGPTDYKNLLATKRNNINKVVFGYSNNYTDTEVEKNTTDGKVKIDLDKIFTNEDIEKIKKKINENYDSTALSKREKFSIQNQIAICYKNAIIHNKKVSGLKAFVNLEIKKNGYIDIKTVKINIPDGANANDRDIMFRNIMTSINYCNPLRNLPATKYNAWRVINLVFNDD